MIRERVDFYLADGSTDLFNDESSINVVKKAIADYLTYYNIGFTITNQVGGYLCDDGKYAVENSLVISIAKELEEQYVDEFIEYFKKEYKQESVLVCKKKIVMSEVK